MTPYDLKSAPDYFDQSGSLLIKPDTACHFSADGLAYPIKRRF